MEFIDDYRLLAGLGSTSGLPPFLVLIDTEEVGGTPTQTTFHLSAKFINCGTLFLLSEQGAHGPSPEESLAPFYPDPAQRVVVMQMQSATCYLVVSVGTLLEFKSRGGTEIRWDEWRDRVVAACPFTDETTRRIGPWVSGCRLFSIFSTQSCPDLRMQVHDFSLWGRARYLSKEANRSFGGLRCLSSTPAQAQIPWDRLIRPRSGHDSILFPHVSLIVPHSL